MKRSIANLIVHIVMIGTLMMSCSLASSENSTKDTIDILAETHETIISDSLHTTSYSETDETTKDTESVSFVPYTLKHTVVDITNDLPDDIMMNAGIYCEDYELHYRNTYAKDGKLLIYGQKKTEEGYAGYLYVYTDGVRTEEIPVPSVRGMMPQYAYVLADGCFALLWSEGESLYYFGIAESDGTLRSELCLDEVCPGLWENGDFVLREVEDGNVVLLHRAESGKFICIEYNSEKQEMTVGRTVYQKQQNRFKHLSFTEYLGNDQWLPVWSVDECSVLNMKTGIYEDKEFRVPEDKDHMVLTVGLDGKYYLYDMLGMYEYQDNLPPSKVADWMECGITADLYYRNLWVIDEHSFYITKSRFENYRYTDTKLYYIHTEMVPDENPKQVIDFDYYGVNDWVRDAVLAFNRESEEYEINLNYVDVVNMGQQEREALLADRMVNQAHPDVLMIDPRVTLDDYYDKNAFLDLTPYIGDQLLGCVTDAVRWGDALYSVPMNMQIYTFLCLPEVTEAFLTWDVFIDSVRSLDGQEVLYSDPRAEKYLYENGIMDFFDLAAGKANYDSDKFRSVMTLLEGLEENYLDETAGYLTSHSDGTGGYTNPTLPARLREGGLTYLNMWINSPEQVMMARHLYGDTDFVWCGYPSDHGGGAYVNLLGYTAVLADTDAPEGSIAFLQFLLDAERQTEDTHQNLPVTRDAIRLLFEKNRYYSYSADRYHNIGNSSAPMRETSLSFDTTPPIVPLSAEIISDEPLTFELDENGDPTGYCVALPQADIDAFLYFLDHCHMSAGSDDTVEAIVTEELSYWQNGVKSLAEVTKIIQSRVSIYLAERQ